MDARRGARGRAGGARAWLMDGTGALWQSIPVKNSGSSWRVLYGQTSSVGTQAQPSLAVLLSVRVTAFKALDKGVNWV